MNQNFDKCMTMLLTHEGGYVNHPSDPGGMTNLGVTKRTYHKYHGTDIDEEGMRQLTKADVMPVYRRNCWNRRAAEAAAEDASEAAVEEATTP